MHFFGTRNFICIPLLPQGFQTELPLQHLLIKLRYQSSVKFCHVCSSWSELFCAVGWIPALGQRSPTCANGSWKFFFKHKKHIFLLWRWSNTESGCPERLWNLHPWWYSKPDWTLPKATGSSWLCLSRGFGQNNLHGCLPTSASLWFCDPDGLAFMFTGLYSQSCQPLSVSCPSPLPGQHWVWKKLLHQKRKERWTNLTCSISALCPSEVSLEYFLSWRLLMFS